MNHFDIVAHRGIPTEAPENTIASFQRAIDLGADAIEFDVRLTSDQIPVVYHYFQLDNFTSATGMIFDFTLEQLQDVEVFCKHNPSSEPGRISTLEEILELFGGQAGLEIHIQGPEPEAAEIISATLKKFSHLWDQFELTSYEPAMLLAFQKICPGLARDLLFPRSESWMTLDVVRHQALHLSRLAKARAVHLHPSQLSENIVDALHNQGTEIHAWDVNDEQCLDTVVKFGIQRVCTDYFHQVRAYRDKMS
jgi:glycerophosphoryl diester phosphodiesterase